MTERRPGPASPGRAASPLKRADLAADISFDRPLAEMEVLTEGFCEPEARFAWTLGTASRIVLRTPGAGAYLLLVQGHPYLHPPDLAAQSLTIAVNDVIVGRLRVDGLFTERLEIPARVITGRRADIVFSHPDSASPSHHGETDTRRLGIRLWRLMLFRLGVASLPARQAADIGPVGAALQIDALKQAGRLSPPELDLAAQLPFANKIPDAALNLALRKLFATCLAHGYCVAASDLARRASGDDGVTLTFDASAGTDHSVLRFTKTASGICDIGLSPVLASEAAHEDGGGTTLIVWRLLAVLPMLTRYARSARPAGTCFVSLGDEGHTRGLAFCNVRSMDSLLVPDPYFLASDGYASLRGPVVAWAERRGTAFWRGAPTGYRTGRIEDLPRVKLCMLGMRPENAAWLDAGLVGTQQLQSTAEQDFLQRIGAVRDFVPSSRFQDWKYTIDIDGNTNAWPGLYQKLLSGAVVLKIDSAGPYSQWYYDRLRPFETYVPVRADMGDLVEKIKILRANDGMAQAIGAAGRALALAMTRESEIEAAQATIETALLIETHTAGLPALL